MRKITLLGERPGPNTDPLRPLFPHTTTGAAANLARMMGLSREEYLEITDRYNVCDSTDLRESPASMIARDKVRRLWDRLVNSQEIELLIVCGREAQRALPRPWRIDLEMLEPEYVPFGLTVLLIPHPSRRNRVFNDKSYLEKTQRILRHEIALWRLGGAVASATPASGREHVLEPVESLTGTVGGGPPGQGAARAADALRELALPPKD